MSYDEIKKKLYENKLSIISTTATELTDAEKRKTVVPGGFAAYENRERNSKKEAYIKMLSFDYQIQEWIDKPEQHADKKQKRNTRKNIDENYKAVTGNKSGLSSATLKKRKAEFTERRDLSAEASLKISEYIKTEEWDVEPDTDALIEEIDAKELNDFKFEGGRAFIEKFGQQMPILRKAEMLFERLMSGAESQKLSDDKKDELLKKLAWMKDVKQLYEDRMNIVSSPYFVSIRDEDLKGNLKRLRKLAKDKSVNESLRRFAGAVVRIKEREEGTFKGKEEYSSERAADLLEHYKEDYKDTLAKKSVAGNIVDNIVRKIGSSKINDYYEDDDDLNNFWVKRWIYEDLNTPITPEEFKKTIDKMEKDIDKLSAKDPGKTRILRAKLKKVMGSIKDALSRGEISMDVARLWLDRALMQDKQLGRKAKIYARLQDQTRDGLTLKESGHDAASLQMQHESFSNGICNTIFSSLQEKKGYRVTLQATDVSYVAEEELEAVKEKALREWQERKADWQKRKKKYEKDNPGKKYPDFKEKEPVVKKLSELKKDSQERGDYIHIHGKNCEGEMLTRAYISAIPGKKQEALKHFMQVLESEKVLDEVYFKVSNTGNENRVDDMVVYFGKQLKPEKIKEVMDKFYAGCNMDNEEDPILLGGNYMAATTSKYADGISFASEPDTAMMLNLAYTLNNKFVNTKQEEQFKKICPGLRPQFSYNTFIIDMFTISMVVANRRLGKDVDDPLDIDDEKTLTETKKVFRELCLLNGLDPETMVDEDVRSVILQKKAGKKA